MYGPQVSNLDIKVLNKTNELHQLERTKGEHTVQVVQIGKMDALIIENGSQL